MNQAQLADLRRGLDCNAQAYERIRRLLRPGLSELELLAEVQAACARMLGYAPQLVYDLVSGPRSGGAEGAASDRRIEAGDCVIVDILPRVAGTWCDTTRTFFAGPPAPAVRAAYEAALRALRAGEACLRPGAVAGEIFAAVDGCIRGAGLRMGHHAGHALGAHPVEEPDFVRGATGTLEAGMVVALEPGCYRAGSFGVRVENDYLITPGGCEKLFDYPLEIDYFIV